VVRVAPGSGLLAAAILLVHRGPGDPLGGLLGFAFLLLAGLDVGGLALLLVGVAGFVAAWHIDVSKAFGGWPRPNLVPGPSNAGESGISRDVPMTTGTFAIP